MKVKVKKLEELSKVELSIVFTKEEFDAEFEKQLVKALETAEVKGFRKGKVPRNIYLSKFGDVSVKRETIDQLINSSYPEAVKSKKIDVVGQPEIDLLDKLKEDEFGYKATVSVYPTCEPKDYLGIEGKLEETNITDEDVENEAKRILKQHADLEVAEGAQIEKGDTAVFDFCGSIDGVEFEGGKSENYALEIGSGQFIPGFEEQMIGLKANDEKVLKVTFPKQYKEDLAGKDAEFKVLVHEVKKTVLPELNDEFVASLELENIKTIAEWKEYLKNNLEVETKEANQNKFEDEVFKKLLENNPIVIPQDMIENQVENKINELKQTAQGYGIPVEYFLQYQGIKDLDQYKELVTPGVKEQIHYEIVISAICEAEKVVLDENDFEKYYAQMAKGKDVAELKAKYPKEAVTYYFKMLKTHDLILANVK